MELTAEQAYAKRVKQNSEKAQASFNKAKEQLGQAEALLINAWREEDQHKALLAERTDSNQDG
jgi:hypothetical protein